MKKVLFAAMAATFLFASCAKGDESRNAVKEGIDTRMALSLSFSNAAATRADAGDLDENATEKEAAFETAHVFIFNGSGLNCKVHEIEASKFANDGTDAVYTLEDENAIETTTGAKVVYVGLNLPSDFPVVNGGSVGVLEEAWATTAANLVGENSVAMFCTSGASKTFEVVETAGEVPAANVVELNVERMMAKLIVQKKAAIVEDYEVVTKEGSVASLKFYIAQQGTSMYPMAQGTTPAGVTGQGVSADFLSVVDKTDADEAPYYIYGIENIPATAQEGNTTYIQVQAKFTPAEYIDGEGEIVDDYDGDDFWVVKTKLGNVFFTNVTDACTYVKDVLELEDTLADALDHVTTYRKGLCYYDVYIRNSSKVYSFVRNNIYQLTVTEIEGLGKPGLGEPGDPGTDPADPDDPEDPTDPGDPGDPEDPEKPIEVETLMRVEIKVIPWTLNAWEAPLS